MVNFSSPLSQNMKLTSKMLFEYSINLKIIYINIQISKVK